MLWGPDVLFLGGWWCWWWKEGRRATFRAGTRRAPQKKAPSPGKCWREKFSESQLEQRRVRGSNILDDTWLSTYASPSRPVNLKEAAYFCCSPQRSLYLLSTFHKFTLFKWKQLKRETTSSDSQNAKPNKRKKDRRGWGRDVMVRTDGTKGQKVNWLCSNTKTEDWTGIVCRKWLNVKSICDVWRRPRPHVSLCLPAKPRLPCLVSFLHVMHLVCENTQSKWRHIGSLKGHRLSWKTIETWK